MPTVIALDVSLSMTSSINGHSDDELSKHQLAVQGINEFLDHLASNSKLEFVSLEFIVVSANVCHPLIMSHTDRKYVEVQLHQEVTNLSLIRSGPRFLTHIKNHRYGFNSPNLLPKVDTDLKINENQVNFNVDVNYLKSLDPKEWKNQDHYAVLGLKELRFNATEDEIKRAYRKSVLKHHPDKRKANGEEVNTECDYFTCITKAYEILGNPKSRRSYDSVDPEFDDALPTNSEIDKDFFKVFDKYFKLNARWSEQKNVPFIGDENSTRDQVEHFYNFWYDFESWREYSYLDEEDKEKGQDREERRWIEKQNKAIRIKRKKEEMSRIRALVDLSYNNDPRILKFKKEEKQRKLAAKRAKMDVVQALKAEEERVIREAQLAKERAEQAEQKRIEQVRLEREQQKKAIKKERKLLRDKAKENNYFSSNDDEKVKHMEGVEKICESLKCGELQNFNKELEIGGQLVFLRMLSEIEQKLSEEKTAMLKNLGNNQKNTNTTIKSVDKRNMWTPENTQLLIKAVNLFPAGTAQRWEVISSFMNQHSTNINDRKFQARDVLNKAKDLQSSNFSNNELKAQTNKSAFVSFEKTKKDNKKLDNSDISVKVDKIEVSEEAKSVDIKQDCNVKVNAEKIKPQSEASKPWTKEEQALLEQAIKTYPISTPDRWDKISECIPHRTKKDCLRRVKELVDRVNAKKEAQQAFK